VDVSMNITRYGNTTCPARPSRPRFEFNGKKPIQLGAGVGEIWIFSTGDAYTRPAPAF